MSSKTKIVVLHMKEIIYTGLFALLAILFIMLLVIMFVPDSQKETVKTDSSAAYVPGIYTQTLLLGNSALEIELVLDEDHINSIRMKHLDEAITTMYPLITPSFDSLVEQICEKQDLKTITYPEETKYTSTLLLNAIGEILEKARAD
ncbi:MAG: hypothetical protein E7294_13395 [Lachnospiraceae bacterium]|nr:hypothetical protein [Lachnospiraceae bacterium]